MTLPSPDELRRLIEAATPDWQQQHDFALEGELSIVGNVDEPEPGRYTYTQVCEVSDNGNTAECRANARIIANALNLARAYLALTEENARLKRHIDGLRVLGTELSQAGPTWQCPNCGSWHHQHEPHARSSGPHGTLYNVCQQCADNHTAFAALAEARK